MKFILPPREKRVQEIYRRHEGPYTLLVVQQRPGREMASRWQRQMYVRGEDVDTAAMAWFEEEDTLFVSVWSEAEKYFVTTYQRRDVEDGG